MVDTRVSEILENLSKHLEESKTNLEMLREDSSISDAIDLVQLDSDVEVQEESSNLNREQTCTDIESEIEIEDENKLQIEKLSQSHAEEAAEEMEQETEVVDPKPPKDAEKKEKEEVEKKEDKKEEKKPDKEKDKPTDLTEDDPVQQHEIKTDFETNDLNAKKSKENYGSLQAYIGAELYNKRMFPHGCPSYQKAFVKLFKVEKSNKGSQKVKLIDV